MVKTVVELLAVQNPVFTTFVAWSSILVIKMICMSFFTAITRQRTKVRFTKKIMNTYIRFSSFDYCLSHTIISSIEFSDCNVERKILIAIGNRLFIQNSRLKFLFQFQRKSAPAVSCIL